MVAQIAGDGKFAPVQRGVSQSINAILSHNLQSHKITSGTANDHFRIGNFHLSWPTLLIAIAHLRLEFYRKRSRRTSVPY